MAKLFENLLKDSTLPLFDIAYVFFSLGSLIDPKMPLVNFFRDTRYLAICSTTPTTDTQYSPNRCRALMHAFTHSLASELKKK